jgi:hypothetical protein
MSGAEHDDTDPRIPVAATDRRHRPGPDALPLWNESFWFALYDPDQDIGISVRWGLHPRLEGGYGNFYLGIVHRGEPVYTASHHRAPLPPEQPDRLELANGLTLHWLEPLRSFRLVFGDGDLGFDLTFTGMSAPYLYDSWRNGSPDDVPRHIEQGGRATGAVTIGGVAFRFDGHAHRDHTYGGERDWEQFYRWNYLSGEIGRFWFNAVRIKFDADMDWLYVGCVFDGERVLALTDLAIEVTTVQGGARATAARLVLTDEAGAVHRIETDAFLGVCPFLIRRTWLKDGFVRYRMGGAVGYGILEHGYREDDALPELV